MRLSHRQIEIPSGQPARWVRQAAYLQCLVLGVVLFLCRSMPHTGGTILLVPLRTRTTAIFTDIPNFSILRAGLIPGSTLVKVKGDVPIMALLANGVLPLGAPDWLCTSSAPIPRQTNKGG